MQKHAPRFSKLSLSPDAQDADALSAIEAEPSVELVKADSSLNKIYQEAVDAYNRKVRKKWSWESADGVAKPGLDTLMQQLEEVQERTHEKVKIADTVARYSHALEGFLTLVDNYCSTIGGPGFIASQALVSCIQFALTLTEGYAAGLRQIEQGLSTMVSVLGLSQIFTIVHQESDPEIQKRLSVEIEKLYGVALEFWVRAVASFTPRKFFSSLVQVVWRKFPRHYQEFETKFRQQLSIVSAVSAGLSRYQEIKRKDERRKVAALEAKYKECVDRFKTGSSSPEKFKSELKRISEIRHKGTCKWIEEEEAYKGWVSGHTDILWVSGQAGMGKSVLASSLIEASRAQAKSSTTNDVVLYFFCLHDQPEKRDATCILKSLCFQLFQKLVPSSDELSDESSLQRKLVDTLLSHAETAFQGATSLSYRFHELRSHFDNVTILIDGLDECRKDDIETLLRNLLRFVGCKDGKRLKVLITSRPDPPIYNHLIPSLAEFELEDYEDQIFPFTPKEGYNHPIEEGQASEELELRHFKILPKHVSSDIIQYASYKLELKALGMSRAEYSAASIRDGSLAPSHLSRVTSRSSGSSAGAASITGSSDSASTLSRTWTVATSYTGNSVEPPSKEAIGHLAEIIRDRSQGHFLWVYYVLKEVEENTTRFRRLQDIENYLSSNDGKFESERNLEEIYARILCRLEKTLYDYAKQFVRCILRWTCCAYRPLRLEEIAEVIKANTERLHLENDKHLQSSDEWMNYTEVEIRKLCGSLVIFRTSEDEQQSTRTLHFVHFSIKEFLLNKDVCFLKGYADKWDEEFYRSGGTITGQFLVAPARGHGEIFEDCMFYLSQDRFKDPLEHIRGNAFPKEKTRQWFPLFEYAALNWSRHLMDCNTKIDAAMKEIHTAALAKFFGGNTYRTWMEGIVGFKGGIESFFVIQLALQKQLSSVNPKSLQTFTNWASDVGGFGFLDYEQTVLHNSNEIHYLDHRVLFPKTSKAYSKRLTNLVRAEVFQKLECPDDMQKDLVRRQTTLVLEGQLRFPRQFFSGEDNDQTFGFLSVDRNNTGKQGVFTIDRKCNHPRLIWERLKADEGEDVEFSNTRLAKLIQLKKKVPHSIWTTFGAVQSSCGTAVAGLFAEALVKKEGKDQQYRLKVSLWRFRASDMAKLNKWLEDRNLRPGPGRLPGQDLEDIRPTVPSIKPSIAGEEWAVAEEVGGDRAECIIDEHGPFEGSKGLIAFRGDYTVLFPFGIYYMTTQEYAPFYDLVEAKETDGTTILPGGQHIVRFTSKARLQLEIIAVEFDDNDIAPDSQRPFGAYLTTVKTVSASVVNPPLSRFVRIMACSNSGKHVLILGERQEASTIVLLVVDILSGGTRVIYERPFKHGDVIDVIDASFSADDSRIIFATELRSARLFSKVYTLMYYLRNFHKLYAVRDLPGKPDNLILYEDAEALYAIILSNHRNTFQVDIPETPYGLQEVSTSYSEAELQNVVQFMSLQRQAVERYGICRTQYSEENGVRKPKALLAGYMNMTVKRSKRETADVFTRTVSIDVNFDVWEASQFSGQDWLWSSNGNFQIPAFDITETARHAYGISSSYDLHHLVSWCGEQVYYFSTIEGGEGRRLVIPGQDDGNKPLCLEVLFHRTRPLAVQLSSSTEELAEQRIGDSVFFWTFSAAGAEPVLTRTIQISCPALGMSWHPSEPSLFITGTKELSLYDVQGNAAECVRTISRKYVEEKVAKLDKTNGAASPPSTATTHILDEYETELQSLRFSSCGTYLFNHRWNTFFTVASLRNPSQITFSSASVLASFAASGDRKNFWSRGITPSHPITMQENMLYSASQQRFKIFNIRTYLVLGWAADANSLWDPIDLTKKDDPPTWYRRVLCAIPQSLGGWQATLIWPDEPEARLWVVFFPREFTGGHEKPKTVLCPIKAGELMETVRRGDDWLKGHAESCPYHLGLPAATQ